MQRRSFLKFSLVVGSAIMMPLATYADELDIDTISFSQTQYNDNQAQTILIFMYGGASQLAGNITNLEEIEKHSQKSYYSYFRNITPTEHGCWQEAGGDIMEKLIQNGDMTLFRTCYSQVREDEGNKAHGVCTSQNQRGTFQENTGGVLTNLAAILQAHDIINEETLMPFVTMEGESYFYTDLTTPLPGYLKPVGINENLDNPYKRDVRRWFYYTDEEREEENYNRSDEEGGFDPELTYKMDRLAQKGNLEGKIKDAFDKRASLSRFLDEIASAPTPDLGEDAYHTDSFSKKLETAVKLLVKNPDTKAITIGTGGLGGWDDHNDAKNYPSRMEQLFNALNSAIAHLKAEGKEDTISIMVFGEFGRNVNLNAAYGWDHGNLQNLYVLGGKRYFNHQGVVGETILEDKGAVNRLFLKPKEGSYWFEPLSIAATLYKIYGIDNPEILTDAYSPISPLFS